MGDGWGCGGIAQKNAYMGKVGCVRYGKRNDFYFILNVCIESSVGKGYLYRFTLIFCKLINSTGAMSIVQDDHRNGFWPP